MRIRSFPALAIAVVVSGCAVPQPNTPFARTRHIAPGVDHTERRMISNVGPWSIHVAAIDWPGRDLCWVTALASNTVFGLQTVPDQVQAVPVRLGKPLLAVNGDFFVIKSDPYQGDPTGLQIWNGELVSGAIGGTTFWMDRGGKPRLGDVYSRLEATLAGGQNAGLLLNQARPTHAVALYTPRLGPRTRTLDGKDLLLERHGTSDWLPLRAGSTLTARVAEIREGGNASIAPDRLVLSIGPQSALNSAGVQVGDLITLAVRMEPSMNGVQTAIGGGPVLVANGVAREFKLPQPRHPRTALGWNDRQIFLVVVDGRQPGHSVGMTFPELAEFMLSLGCRDALNLDGGGSSTFWLQGQVRNRPSDGRNRAVANSLILLRSTPSPGAR